MITKQAGTRRAYSRRQREAQVLLRDPSDPRDRELALRHLYGWGDQ